MTSNARHYSTRQRTPPILVAIVGGSGSGKTWLAEKLEAALGPNAARVSLDDFYRDRSHLPAVRRTQINFDHPRAIDWTKVERMLRVLAAGRPARIPLYDFKTHSRLKGYKVLTAKPIILVDGLWLLRRPALRAIFRLRIFLDCPTRIRLARRLARDLGSRGRTALSVREQFWGTVEPMHRLYVVPQQRYADIVVREKCGPREITRLARQIRTGIRPN